MSIDCGATSRLSGSKTAATPFTAEDAAAHWGRSLEQTCEIIAGFVRCGILEVDDNDMYRPTAYGMRLSAGLSVAGEAA